MKATIDINGKPTEIELTPEQVEKIKKASQKITDRVKTFEDALSIKGMTKKEFYELARGLRAHEIGNRKWELLAEVLNEGKEGIYYPWMRKNAAGSGFSYGGYVRGSTYSHVGPRLKFASVDLTKYFATQFVDVINEAWS